MPEPLPPNTHDIDVRVRVTLPPGEAVEKWDPFHLLIQDVMPFEGVQIHAATLLRHATVPPTIDPEKEKKASEVMCRLGLKADGCLQDGKEHNDIPEEDR